MAAAVHPGGIAALPVSGGLSDGRLPDDRMCERYGPENGQRYGTRN
ncbi:hypothetical protein [Streptomyces sp. NBC_00847]|nr:hypothetical protein [Streptomyces sp. NBC_00847]MCX4880275.1 hypothetical protein [Streptomyces sp. NBC_00847]